MDLMHDWLTGLTHVTWPMLFLVNYVANALPMPGWPIPVAAGFVLEFGWGLALVFCSQMLGATTAFYLARTILRERIRKIVNRFERLKAIDHAMREEGWRAVMLLQLTPMVPFGLQNYLLGMSKVKLESFVTGTALGTLPSMMFYVGLGSTGRFLAGDEDGPAKWVLFGIGVAAAFTLTWLISRIASRRLKRYRHA